MKTHCGVAILCIALIFLSFVCADAPIALTQADKDSIIAEHTRIRSQVVPAASNMQTIVWDDSLAQIWVNYPDHCVWGHTTNDYRTSVVSGYSWIGENLAAGYSYDGTKYVPYSYAHYVGQWEDEKYNWTYNTIDAGCQSGAVCGHYTQLIWASSVKVGCTMMDCPSNQYKYIFACDYGPGGNYQGQKPYTAGAATCTPKTCAAQGYNCGSVSDTCGGTAACSGNCTSSQKCTNNKCTSCITATCSSSGYNCGTLFNGCANENCGACTTSQTCVSNVCQNNNVTTCTPTTCSAASVSCNSISNGCGTQLDCGSCPSGYQCQSGSCAAIPDPCNNTCSVSTQSCNITTRTCMCLTGYEADVNGNCNSIPSNPTSSPASWVAVKGNLGDWTTEVDQNSVNVLQMYVSGVADHALSWSKAQGYSSDQKTVFAFDVSVSTSQTFGIAMRLGQSTGANDASLWTFAVNTATNKITLGWDLVYYGSDNVQSLSTTASWTPNAYNNIKLSITNSNGQLSHTVTINGARVRKTWNVPSSYYPNVGGMYLYTNNVASFKNVVASTANTVHVGLGQCLTADQWAQTVSKALGISVSQVNVTRVDDDQGRCSKKRQAGVGSGFTFTIASDATTSSTAYESTLANMASQGSPQLSTQVSSYSAAEPTLEFADPVFAASALAAPEVAGAGAAATLSTGAIIGIAVGGGVAALIVLAAIAAVIAVVVIVVVRKSRKDDYFNQPTTDVEMVEKPKKSRPFSIRKKKPRTGVDVYSNDPNKHKSITGRVPSAYIDTQADHVSKETSS